MESAMSFEKTVLVVTGAARGIGAATAAAFVEAGARVVMTDTLEQVEDTAADLRSQGGEVRTIVGDISCPDVAQQLVDTAVKEYGRVDFAFNNAGIGGNGHPLHELPDDVWDQMLAVNLTSVFRCVRAQLQAMLKTGGGVIINNSSVCGVRAATTDFAHYIAAKHGVVGLSRATTVEYASRGIRCVAIGPGFIKTDMTDKSIHGDLRDAITARIPQGRMGSPAEVGRAVRLLCSTDASYINGAYLQVDGGLIAS